MAKSCCTPGVDTYRIDVPETDEKNGDTLTTTYTEPLLFVTSREWFRNGDFPPGCPSVYPDTGDNPPAAGFSPVIGRPEPVMVDRKC